MSILMTTYTHTQETMRRFTTPIMRLWGREELAPLSENGLTGLGKEMGLGFYDGLAVG